MEGKQAAMAEQLDDAENRSRQYNITILNLKDGTKGDHPIEFLESWLSTTLGLSTAEGCIKLDWAHQTFEPKSDHPCPVIIKIHNS